jgi:hypothetical protein
VEFFVCLRSPRKERLRSSGVGIRLEVEPIAAITFDYSIYGFW